MNLLLRSVINDIQESQAKSMERMLKAWDKEIEAHQQALIAINQQKQAQANQQKLLSSSLEQQNQAAIADASALELYLRGLVSQAQGGQDVSISLPVGVRIASSIGGDTSMAEIGSLISQARTADDEVHHQEQHSALWALEHGFMPHPSDLSKILQDVGTDSSWQNRFSELGNRLDQLDKQVLPHPQLQAVAGRQKLDCLSSHLQLLGAYGPNRTLSLVLNPQSLAKSPSQAAPQLASLGPKPKMGEVAFNRMLNNLL